jgi:hypothetical protein
MVVNIGRSVPHFSQMREEFVERQTYAGVLDWLKNQPSGVVFAPEDLNSYIPTLTKQYVLYNRYGAHFAVSDDENHERFLLYHAFDQLTESEFIKGSIEYYGPIPSYLAKTSALRSQFCAFLRISESCSAPQAELSFIDGVATGEKFATYYPDITSRIEEEYARYHVQYIVSKTGERHPLLGGSKCPVVYHDQWFEACTIVRPRS